MNLNRITAAGALALGVVVAASAQSEEAPATNAPIIVTASRTGRSADEIASGNADLAQRTSAQAASVESTASSATAIGGRRSVMAS
jgi:methyl-accepting chemotaxis protein